MKYHELRIRVPLDVWHIVTVNIDEKGSEE